MKYVRRIIYGLLLTAGAEGSPPAAGPSHPQNTPTSQGSCPPQYRYAVRSAREAGAGRWPWRSRRTATAAHRVLAALCGWIPLVNLWYLAKILRICSDEVEFETQKWELDEVRAESPKSPHQSRKLSAAISTRSTFSQRSWSRTVAVAVTQNSHNSSRKVPQHFPRNKWDGQCIRPKIIFYCIWYDNI